MDKVLKTSTRSVLTGFTHNVIQEAVDKRHETPALAANFLKVMRGMFGWARRMRIVSTDPTGDIVAPTYKTDGFPAWTVSDVR